MINKQDIIDLYNQGYSTSTIANKLFLNNRYTNNLVNIKDSQKVVESVIFDYVTHISL